MAGHANTDFETTWRHVQEGVDRLLHMQPMTNVTYVGYYTCALHSHVHFNPDTAIDPGRYSITVRIPVRWRRPCTPRLQVYHIIRSVAFLG